MDAKIATWQSYLTTGIVAVIFAPGFVYSANLEQAQLRHIAFICAELVAGLVLLVASSTYLRGRTIGERPTASFVTALLASVIFVVSIRLFSEFLLHLEIEKNALPRAANAVLAVTIWQIYLSVVVSDTKKFRIADEELELALAKEKKLELVAVEQLESLRLRVAGEVTAALNVAFEKLAMRNRLDQTSAQLRDLIDAVIKPLSERLSSREPDDVDFYLSEAETGKARRSTLKKALITVVNVRPFDRAVVPAAIAVLTNFSRYWAGDPVPPWALFILCWADFTVLMHFGAVLQKAIQQKVSQKVWFALAIGYTIFASAFDALLTQVVFQQLSPIRFLELFTGSILVLAVSAIGRGLYLDRKKVLDEMRVTTSRLTWMNARLRQLIWVEKRRLARLVHGDIQSRIMATALSIELGVQDQSELKNSLEALRKNCELALVLPVNQTSFITFIESLQELWSASLLIENQIPEELIRTVELDSVLVDTLIELVREGVTNSVKHGSATKITVKANTSPDAISPGSSLLFIQLEDNGISKSDLESRRGSGSILLDQITASWQLIRGEFGTTLAASIPLRLNVL